MKRWWHKTAGVALLALVAVGAHAASSSDYLISRELSAVTFTVYKWTGFETTFHIDRTAFGVNGSKWSGGKLLISSHVEIHVAHAATERALYTHAGRKR